MSDDREITNYRHLRDYLNSLTAAQLDQPVQVMPSWPDGTRPVPLMSGIAVGTLAGLGCEASRSSEDNDHHPESVVILADVNPFNEDGTIGEDLITGERVWANGRVRDWSVGKKEKRS